MFTISNISVFSDEVIYRAEPFGGEVELLCYQVMELGAYMKYFYQDKEEKTVAPEQGAIIEKGGKKYQEVFAFTHHSFLLWQEITRGF